MIKDLHKISITAIRAVGVSHISLLSDDELMAEKVAQKAEKICKFSQMQKRNNLYDGLED